MNATIRTPVFFLRAILKYITPIRMPRQRPSPVSYTHLMDTSPAVSGKDVKPRIVENYDGRDILLNQEKGIILPVKENPELQDYVGKSLIVTDGTTLLGTSK